MRRLAWVLAVSVGVVSSAARAATINVGAGDSYAKIEGAKAGDEVVIAPGTYGFRVYLTQKAPAGNPIVIRAADPSNPPVWDLSAGYVENAPGSYTAGDRGRGCWQLSGATNIQISGLVITGCHGSDADSAGMRYYEGTSGILLSNVVFRGNDNGLTGGSQSSQITVEFCEFDANGTLLASSSSPSHNIYIYGGDFTLRYSYVHDPVQAQNFHIRAQTSLIEYNWFARAVQHVHAEHDLPRKRHRAGDDAGERLADHRRLQRRPGGRADAERDAALQHLRRAQRRARLAGAPVERRRDVYEC
jgi:hypothetical protein